MAQYSAYASLSGFLKEHVIPKIANVVPEEDVLGRLLPMPKKKGTQVGKQIALPVMIQAAQGMTFGGSDSSAYTIGTSVSPETDQALIKPSSFVQELPIAQDMIDRMKTDSQSVIASFALLIKALTEQATFAQEISLQHGTRGIGKVKAQTADNGTTQTFSITARTWAPAIWQRMLGASVDCYNVAAKVTATTVCVITGYSLTDKTVTMTGTEADMDNFAAGYDFYPATGYGNQMQGLGYIAGSTALTIHGIDQSSVYAWHSNLRSAGASKLSYALVADAIADLRNRGCRDDLTMLVDPISAKHLKVELGAAIRPSSSGARWDAKTSVLGFDTQDVKIVENIYQWPGEATLFDLKVMDRVGQGIQFVDLGGGTNNYVMALATKNGAYCRVNWNQALFCKDPTRVLKIHEIGSAAA